MAKRSSCALLPLVTQAFAALYGRQRSGSCRNRLLPDLVAQQELEGWRVPQPRSAWLLPCCQRQHRPIQASNESRLPLCPAPRHTAQERRPAAAHLACRSAVCVHGAGPTATETPDVGFSSVQQRIWLYDRWIHLNFTERGLTSLLLRRQRDLSRISVGWPCRSPHSTLVTTCNSHKPHDAKRVYICFRAFA